MNLIFIKISQRMRQNFEVHFFVLNQCDGKQIFQYFSVFQYMKSTQLQPIS